MGVGSKSTQRAFSLALEGYLEFVSIQVYLFTVRTLRFARFPAFSALGPRYSLFVFRLFR